MMDQHTTFIDKVPVAFNLEAIGRKLNIRADQTRILDKLSAMAKEAQGIARPRGAAMLCGLDFMENDQVRVGEVVFTSPLLRQNMGELGRAFPYMATEGTELADWCLSLSSSTNKIFGNALREVAVKQCEALIEKTLMEKYGIGQLSAMNPGSLAVWPIAQQEPFFQLMSPLPEKLGVTLLPSLMMKPEHSLSGIFFQTETKYFNCQLCPREDCPNRRAPSTVI